MQSEVPRASQPSRSLVEALVSSALWRLGVIRRLQRRRVARLLPYHNVAGRGDPVFGMPEAAFRAQMAFLKRHYAVVSLDGVSAMLAGRQPWVERAVAITFDDGYEDNFRVAWPILRDLRLPATIFLTTDYLGAEGGIWLNRLHIALRETPLSSFAAPEVLGPEAPALTLSSPAARDAAGFTLVDALYHRLPAERKALTEAILERLQVDLAALSPTPSALRFLNWDQVREMADSGLITFGSHGCSHSIVSRLSDEVLREELTVSKAIIERETGRPVLHFAYPNGGLDDFDARAVRLLPELGYHTASTMCRGLAHPDTPPFALPRLGYLGAHGPTFAKRLESLTLRKKATPR